jgi:hypothetical protein
MAAGLTDHAWSLQEWLTRPAIPSPIQYFLPCSMTACALFDPGLIVSNVAHS